MKKIKWPTFSQIEANRGSDYLRIPSAVQGMGERDGGAVCCVYVGVLERDETNKPSPQGCRDSGSPHLSTVGYSSEVNK